MKKPLIGLIPLYDDEKDSLWMLPGYMDAVAEAGGLPIMLPLTEDDSVLSQIASLCDGFLLTGGHDVSPYLYGESPIEECGICMPDQKFVWGIQWHPEFSHRTDEHSRKIVKAFVDAAR